MRATRTKVAALVALGVLVALAGGGWYAYAGASVGGVTAAWDGPPKCAGTDVVTTDDGELMIVASKQMRCRIDVRLTNSGSRAVEVAEAIGTFAGPETGTIFEIVGVDGNAPSSASERDAYVPIARPVPAAGALVVEVVLQYHREGCNGGGQFWVSGWPAFTVSSLGRSQQVQPPDELRFRIRGSLGDCESS